jgi:hypothetical protein
MINDEILKITKQAFIEILTEGNDLELRHKFRLNDKSTLGILLFLLGGVFLLVITFVKSADTTSKIIGTSFGLLLLFLSILTLIRQFTDGLKIKDGILIFRYNIKKRTIHLNGDMKIKMKIELMKISRVGTLGSDFIYVSHYLQDQKEEIPIFKFSMENTNAESAKKLGNELTRIINSKFKQ